MSWKGWGSAAPYPFAGPKVTPVGSVPLASRRSPAAVGFAGSNAWRSKLPPTSSSPHQRPPAVSTTNTVVAPRLKLSARIFLTPPPRSPVAAAKLARVFIPRNARMVMPAKIPMIASATVISTAVNPRARDIDIAIANVRVHGVAWQCGISVLGRAYQGLPRRGARLAARKARGLRRVPDDPPAGGGGEGGASGRPPGWGAVAGGAAVAALMLRAISGGGPSRRAALAPPVAACSPSTSA